MPQNQEDIEAKLAAYIDGELDADGRAEIEKHLQANPQHRTLIADLMKQRELVRSLPHANAPTEIAETLQGQLERSVLLGSGVDAGEDTSMRMSPWPHRGAIAAIVLLTAGLSFLVYKVLPSSKPSPELAVAPQSNAPATLSTEPPIGQPEQPIASAAKDRVFTEKPNPQQIPAIAQQQNNNVVASATPAPSVGPASNEVAADFGAANKNAAVAAAAPGGNQATANQTGGNQAGANPTAVAIGPDAIGGGINGGNFSNSNNAEPLQLNAARQQLATPVKQVSPPQSYMVVTTNDPASTDAQVRAFLIANEIRFEPRSADAQVSDRDYIQSAVDFRRQVAGGAANPSTQPTTRELTFALPSTQPVQRELGNPVVAGKSPTTAPVNGPTIAAGSIAIALAPTATTAPVVGTVVAPTTAPSALPVVQANGLPATQPTTAPAEALESATSRPVEGGETSFYCPDVTPTQVQDLKSMLSLRAGQSAELVTNVQAVYVPLEAKILPDGTEVVNPPTTQQVQRAVDQQVASQQAQQFGAGQAQGQSFLAQQVPQQGPTTQPATNPVSEGKMDLVIVMREGAVSATPQAAPATQPVVQPAGVPNSPGDTQPGEPGTGLKVP